MDGASLAERLDGRPVPVDPGVHVFRFESTAAPGVTADAQVLVRAGEKNREIVVTLAVPAAAGATAAPEPAPGGSTAPPASSGVPALTWVFGGVAVAALGTALAFEVAQALDYNHLSDTCAGHCPPDQVNHVATERWIAGGAAGVGVLALGAAAYVLLTRPSAAHAFASPPVGVEVVALPRGAVGVVAGRF
jgi:hypothetical protein